MLQFVGSGIYSPADCSKFTQVPRRSIKRWIQGYEFEDRSGQKTSAPLWKHELPEISGQVALSFLDLIEVRFVHSLRRVGVSWKTIRTASQKARERFDCEHPFATQRIKTDGRTIFVDAAKETGSHVLLDLAKDQLAFGRIMRPYLVDLDFELDAAARWWPLGKNKRIVLDPKRSFGAPITNAEGVKTSILFGAHNAGKTVAQVAQWYEVSTLAVRDAIQFERSHVA